MSDSLSINSNYIFKKLDHEIYVYDKLGNNLGNLLLDTSSEVPWLNTTKSGVAVPYAKRIKLIIDGSKIEEDLTDFPVLIHLSDESGILNTDVTAFFNELGNFDYLLYDNCDGLFSENWIDNSNDNSYASFYSGKLGLNLLSGQGFEGCNVLLKESFEAVGNYEIMFDWYPVPGTYWYDDDFTDAMNCIDITRVSPVYNIGSWTYNRCDDSIRHIRVYLRSSRCNYITVTAGSTLINTSFTYGDKHAVRIIINFDECKLILYMDGDYIGQGIFDSTTLSNLDGNFKLNFHWHTFDNTATQYYDNIRIIKTHDPNLYFFYKQLAVTSSDGETQQYVEIESWDYLEKEAWFWTKCPILYADTNTDLYLYYDKDAADNDTYVGETGSLAATNVWDNNFVAVYHMVQDPSTGAECVLDSTLNNNHGTPAGSMTTEDLIDGKIGKAIDFDGIDDKITFGSTNRPTNSFTISAIVRSSTVHEIDSESTVGVGGLSGQKYVFEPSHEDLNAGAGVSYGINGVSVYEHGAGYLPALAVYSSNIGTDWNHIMVVYNNKKPNIILNGILVRTGLTSSKSTVYAPIVLGGHTYGYFDGQIDEVRIESAVRSSAWAKADYHSNWDDLIYYEPLDYDWMPTSIWADDENLYIGTTISGILNYATSMISDSLLGINYLTSFLNYPDINSNEINHMHGNNKYLCVTTASGVEQINLETGDRIYTTISGDGVRIGNCFQTSSGRFYYVTDHSIVDSIFDYKRIKIKLDSVTNFSNYQLKIEIPDYFNINNCLNIRFFDLNYNELYFYRESQYSSIFYVKIVEVNTSEIYMLYKHRSEIDFDFYTQLLLHMDDFALTDSSYFCRDIIKNGNVFRTSEKSKFSGYSAYFGGAGSYLDILDESIIINMSLKPSTIDCWVYFSDLTPVTSYWGHPIFSKSCTTGSCEQLFGINPDGSVRYYRHSALGTLSVQTAAGLITLNNWHHVALTVDGAYWRIFVDGVKNAEVASTTFWANPYSSSGCHIGRVYVSNYPQYVGYFRGFIDELRISAGVVRWTSNFIPPNHAYSSSISNFSSVEDVFLLYDDFSSTSLDSHWTISSGTDFIDFDTKMIVPDIYTSLLLYMDYSVTIDSSLNTKSISMYDTVSVSYNKTKFGEASAYFYGNSHLTVSSHSDFNMGTDDFTIDFWIAPVNGGHGANWPRVIQFGSNSSNGGLWIAGDYSYNPMRFILQGYSGGYINLISPTSTSTIPNDIFSHIAIVRASGVFYFFINGVLNRTGSGYPSYSIIQNNIYIGTNQDNNEEFKGYIDDLHISKGIARWVSDFTPLNKDFTINNSCLILDNYDFSSSGKQYYIETLPIFNAPLKIEQCIKREAGALLGKSIGYSCTLEPGSIGVGLCYDSSNGLVLKYYDGEDVISEPIINLSTANTDIILEMCIVDNYIKVSYTCGSNTKTLSFSRFTDSLVNKSIRLFSSEYPYKVFLDWIKVSVFDKHPPVLESIEFYDHPIKSYDSKLNVVYDNSSNWTIPGFVYTYKNGLLKEGSTINDIFVTENTSSYGTDNNVLFLATNLGSTIIEERESDEYNSRIKHYSQITGIGINTFDGVRKWSNGFVEDSAYSYRYPTHGYLYSGDIGSGIYELKTHRSDSSFLSYCDMEYDGGGWTMIMKVDGNSSLFEYKSYYWTNLEVYNETSLDLSSGNAKFQSYNYVAFNEIMLVFTNDFLETSGRLVIPFSSNSMYDLLRYDLFVATNLGRDAWLNSYAFTVGSQPYCNREGFNNVSSRKARIGIFFNNENDCNTCDSVVGVGIEPIGVITTAGGGGTGSGGSTTFKSCQVYIYVR